MKVAELIKLLEKNGWQLIRQTGGHHIYRHPIKGTIVVPVHGSKEVKKGTEMSIRKKAGL